LSVNSIILAGGKGLRLGGDKALVVLDGENLLQRVISRLVFLNGSIVLVIAEKQKPLEVAGYPQLKLVTDIYPGKGPLMGIYSGLLNSDSEKNLVVACDMPFLNKRLIEYMLDVSTNFDITVPRLGNVVEPLHSVYSKNCLASIVKLLVENNLKIDSLLKMVKVRYVEVEEVDNFDPEHLSFFNINTKADLSLARELAERFV
jgi:molybdopterin-guanine dinucleotide biosynthesis protein A